MRFLMGLPYRDKFDFSRLRGCFDDAGGGGTAGGGAGDGAGAGDGGDKGGTGGKTEPFATFPDEASFMRRVGQAAKGEMKKFAESLGFESVEAMQAAAKAKKDADEASKSELEKEKTARAQAEVDKKTALAAANTRLMSAEIKVFAVQAGFVDPADAVALVDKTGIAVDDDGNITGAKEAVEALAKAKPHLMGTGKAGGTPGSAGNGGRQGGGGGDDTEFAANIAKKRADQNKATGDHQNHYFK